MKKLKGTLFSILFLMLLPCISTLQVFAMETSFQLPVEIVLEGDRPVQAETFIIQMKALTQNAPMPEQAEDQQIEMEIQGQEKKEFPAIKFTQPGVYQYEIRQNKGNAKHYTYDSCVYNVTVYCTAEAKKELEITVVALEQGKEEVKKDAVRFCNQYKLPKTPTEQNKPVKTGDDTPIQIFVCVFLISSFMLLYLVVKKHREK